MAAGAARDRFSMYGNDITLDLRVESLRDELNRTMSPFVVRDNQSQCAGGADDSSPRGMICGAILPFDENEVARSVTRTAIAVPVIDELMELYRDGDCYWLVDDRWGMAEVNLVKRSWRAWVLPTPSIDAVRMVESAVLWPMAQILQQRGLHLIPAAAIARDGWSALIISPFDIEPELSRLIRAGYGLIGQRWCAVRDDAGQSQLLHMPGIVRRPDYPRTWNADVRADRWVDLTRDNPWAQVREAQCRTVIIIEPGRRLITRARELSPALAAATLRHAWPILHIRPESRQRLYPQSILPRKCACISVQLSRDPERLLHLLQALRQRGGSAVTDTKEARPDAHPRVTIARPVRPVTVPKPSVMSKPVVAAKVNASRSMPQNARPAIKPMLVSDLSKSRKKSWLRLAS